MPKSNADLREMVYHTDARVTAMEGQLSDMGNAMNRIEQHLLNKPPTFNLGNIMALLGFAATVMIGGAAYLDTQLNHIRDDIVENDSEIHDINEFRHQTHYEMSNLHHLMSQWEHFDELMHKRDDRINQIENMVERAEISRKATGDYAKETRGILSEHLGTHTWGMHKP